MLLFDGFVIIVLFLTIISNGFYLYKIIFRYANSKTSGITEYFVLGLGALILPLFVMSLVNILVSTQFFYLYFILGLVGIVFLVTNKAPHYLDPVRSNWLADLREFLSADFYVKLVIVSTLLLLFISIMVYPKMNFDGLSYYIKDMGCILRSDFNFVSFCQQNLAAGPPNFATSFSVSGYYAYFGNFINLSSSDSSLGKMIFYNQTFGFVNYLTLLALVFSLYDIGCKIFKKKILSLIVVLIFLYTPIIQEYIKYFILSSDLFFLLLISSLISFLAGYKEDITKNSFFISLCLLLLALTKINGLVFGGMLLFLVLFPQIKLALTSKKIILIFVVFLAVAVTYYSVTNSTRNLRSVPEYFFEPTNFLIVMLSLVLFVYLLLANAMALEQQFDFIAIKSILQNRMIFWSILILVFLTCCVPATYFYVSGSPFSSYLNFYGEKIAAIIGNLERIRRDNGDWTSIENYFYGVLIKGYQFYILPIIAIISTRYIVQSKNNIIISFLCSVFLFFLVWIFIITPSSVRHIMFLALPLSIITTFVLSRYPEKTEVLALVLVLFSLPIQTAIYYDILNSSLVFENHWNWDNVLTEYAVYAGGILCLIFILANYRCNRNHAIISIKFVAGILVLANIFLSVSLVMRDNSYSDAVTGYGSLEPDDFLNKLSLQNTTVFYYRIFGIEVFTDYKYKYADLRYTPQIIRITTPPCGNTVLIVPNTKSKWYSAYKNYSAYTVIADYNSTPQILFETKFWKITRYYESCSNNSQQVKNL